MLEPSESLNGTHARDVDGVWHIIDQAKVPFCTVPPMLRLPLQMQQQRQLKDGTPAGEPVCEGCRRNRQILAQSSDQDV